MTYSKPRRQKGTPESLEVSIMRTLGRMEGKQDMILSRVVNTEKKVATHDALLDEIKKKYSYMKGVLAAVAAFATMAYEPIREHILSLFGLSTK